VPKIRSRIYSK